MPDHGFTVAEIAELAGGLAHELRNPLSTMMVNLKLLAEDLQDPKVAADVVRRRALLKVDVLRREAERLQQLFDDFLNLAGPCKLRPAEADLNRIIERLVEFFAPVARNHKVEIEFVPASSGALAWVDDPLVSQALLNLFINAQQAMPAGGTLRIVTRSDPDWAEIEITDSGLGVSAGDRERIFQPFFSTKPGGTGLGLCITRRIVREHGGRLAFDSEPGRGTRFVIELPRRPGFAGDDGP
jgi:signal transduction histidine kinase